MSRETNFIYKMIDMIGETQSKWRWGPLSLGGTTGSGGGGGGPPGGFVGVLPQTRVAGDTTESFAFSSGSQTTLLNNLNNIRAWEMASAQFYATHTSPISTHLNISSGSWHYSAGSMPMMYGGGVTPDISPPAAGTDRYDLLTINTSGTLSWTHGTPAVTPVEPSLPSPTSGSMPLWTIYARSSGSCIQQHNDSVSHYVFRDYRPLFDWGIGGAVAVAGHVIENATLSFTQRANLQFKGTGVTVSDDSVNNASVINISGGSGKDALTDGHILVGDGANIAQDVAMSGDVTITNTGATTVGTLPHSLSLLGDGTTSTFIDYLYETSTIHTPAFAGVRARGSLALPAPVQEGDVLGRFSGFGYGASGFSSVSRGSIDVVASETWNDAAQGTRAQIRTTANGGTTSGSVATFEPDKSAKFASSIESDALTASTVIYSNASKVITSLPNGSGHLANNGSGSLSWESTSGSTPYSFRWHTDGVLSVSSNAAGIFYLPADFVPVTAEAYLRTPNSSGSTVIDIQYSTDTTSWNSLFTDINNRLVLSSGSSASRSTIAQPLHQGNLLKIDIDQVSDGSTLSVNLIGNELGGSGAGGTSIHESAYASPPTASNGDDWRITDSFLSAHRAAGSWSYYYGSRRVVKPIATGWTWFNQGSATLTDLGHLTLYTPGASGVNIRAVTQSVTAGTFSAESIVKPWIHLGSNNSGPSGMCLTDGTQIILFGVAPGANDLYLTVNRYTNSTTYSSSPLSTIWRMLGAIDYFYLRIRESGGTRYFEISPDGVNYDTALSEATGTFLTPTGVGICAETEAVNNSASTTLLHWSQS